jgi:hypothetical protein
LKALDAVQKHGAVLLSKNVLANLNDQVWAHAQDVPIESSMMELAQSQAVRDGRVALRVTVWKNVRGIKQFEVP